MEKRHHDHGRARRATEEVQKQKKRYVPQRGNTGTKNVNSNIVRNDTAPKSMLSGMDDVRNADIERRRPVPVDVSDDVRPFQGATAPHNVGGHLH